MNVQIRTLAGNGDWAWFNHYLPVIRCEDTHGVIAVDTDTQKYLGAFIMDNETQNSIQAHFLILNPMVLRHKFIEFCADLVFNIMGKKCLYALVPADNEKACSVNKKIGFTEKVRLEEAYRAGVDYLLMELTPKNCRYLEEYEHG